MKNWKTTLAGCVSAAIYAVIAAVQAGRIDPKDLAVAGGLAALGILAKDLNVTGGSVSQ
jgi:hypothetical protein